jgi:peptidoglycan/xylan/chitin deacetylase (PgdA/CDA1 family)
MKSNRSAAVTLTTVFGACLLAASRLTMPASSPAAPAASIDVSEPQGSASKQAPSGIDITEPPDSAAEGTSPVPAAASSGIPKPPTAPPTAAAMPDPGASGPASSTTGQAEETQQEVSIPVLNYHSIGTEPDSTLILDPDKFARQMEYLAKEGYTPLSLSDFTLILEKRKTALPKPVLLTFDDGYADNYEQAMPVLKRYGFPATLFMSPGAVGQDGYLTWEQVKEMHKSGWDIQPHGMTHPHLPLLSAAKQKEEITESRRQIEEQLGTTADIFCYPYGEFNKQTLAILQENGFRYAFTIQQGETTSSQSPAAQAHLCECPRQFLHMDQKAFRTVNPTRQHSSACRT